MSSALLRPRPLPLERVRPGVVLLVLTAHLALLWLANLYWPLQSITVQIFQKNMQRSVPNASDKDALNANSQAISRPDRQRFGRAEAMLPLPVSQTETSTPLTGTAQTALTTKTASARPLVAAPAAPEIQPKPVVELPPNPVPLAAPSLATTPTPTTAAAPAPALIPAPERVPERLPRPVVRTVDEKLSEPPPKAPVDAASTPSTPNTPLSTAAASGTPQSAVTGTAVTGVAGLPGLTNSATVAAPPIGADLPLNLTLPPRYVYRPPIAVPRRSLAEMANDQLRRKPRDAFAEGMQSAGNIDCLKVAPEGPAQGLLAIGPLLKRAIEEKCKK